MTQRRMLIAYAHPDDESFGSGGLIAKYAQAGVEVYYLCATNGDLGSVPPEMMGQFTSVAELRRAELDNAARILGIKEVIRLNYKDSGMMGAPSNNDPDSLWYHSQNHFDELVRRVVEVIRRVRPQVVLTFNRFGGYGHPDHIAIQRATEAAFYRAGDPAYVTEQPPYAPQKLYYSGLPAAALKFFAWVMRLRGQDLRRMGTNKDIDFQAVLEHLEPVHARIDVSNYLAIWDAASAAHASQGGGRLMQNNLPPPLRRWLVGRQGFTRVVPPPANDRVDETDLFAGVQI